MGTLSREWAISMAFSIALLLVFGLGLVWLNIERVDMAYELNKIQRQIDEGEALSAKLEVERNTLITPSRLREMAKDCGLGPARPGQIRRVAANGEVEASLLTSLAAEPAKSPAKSSGKIGLDATAAKGAAKSAAKSGGKPAGGAKAAKTDGAASMDEAIAKAATPKPLKAAASTRP